MQNLSQIYKSLDFSTFLKPFRNNACYGPKIMVWLDIVLSLIGEHSYRDKENFLKNMNENKNLDMFLKRIGIEKKLNKTPSKSNFLEYKKHIDFDAFQAYIQTILSEQLQNSELNEIKKDFSFKDAYVHLAIDGKDIKNTEMLTVNQKKVNIKSINYMANGQIIATYINSSEQTYIKDHLGSDLKKVTDDLKKITKKKS